MIECNIYSGRKGRIDYQETGNFESLLEAELYAQEISEMDATDNIPYDERVGVMYLN